MIKTRINDFSAMIYDLAYISQSIDNALKCTRRNSLFFHGGAVMAPPGNSGNFRDYTSRARVMTLCRRDTAGELPNWVSSGFKVGSNCKVARLFRETNYYGDALRFSFRDMYTHNP